MTPSAEDFRLAVTLTVAELQGLVREAVTAALGEQPQTVADAELVHAKELCRRLSVSRTTLHRMRIAGMPAVRMGDTFRFRPSAVMAWLEARERAA